MVHLPKHVVVTNNSNLLGTELIWGETICLRHQEFITDRSNSLSLSPEGKDSDTIFMGAGRSGLPSLHAILEESTGEDDLTSSEGEALVFPSLKVATW
jgi:hypothetical protein